MNGQADRRHSPSPMPMIGYAPRMCDDDHATAHPSSFILQDSLMSPLPRSSAELAAWTPEIESPVWERFPEATSANAQEVYPGVGDPLSFDINMTAIEHGIRTAADRMGLTRTLGLDEWPHLGFFAAYYGHAFINISALREFVKWIPRGDP